MVRIAWNETYAHPLPENHRFPMEKYELIPEQLLYEGTVTEDQFFSPSPLTPAEVLRVHAPVYWDKLVHQRLNRQEERRTGFPQSKELIEREIAIMGGTLACARFALESGAALNVAGGTHHAFRDRGEGFCLLNDQALAAQILLDESAIERALIVDLDVHQGNGTAAIFAHESRVFTFSMHGAKNYPMHKESSDLDIGLPDGITDREYLKLLDLHWPRLLDTFRPNIVFYQCGVDILRTDKLGRLGVSRMGCNERDRKILGACALNQIPVVCSMGGGYSADIREIIEAHCQTFRLAMHYWS